MKDTKVMDFNETRSTFVCLKCHGQQTLAVAKDDPDQAGRPCITVIFTHWCIGDFEDFKPRGAS